MEVHVGDECVEIVATAEDAHSFEGIVSLYNFVSGIQHLIRCIEPCAVVSLDKQDQWRMRLYGIVSCPLGHLSPPWPDQGPSARCPFLPNVSPDGSRILIWALMPAEISRLTMRREGSLVVNEMRRAAASTSRLRVLLAAEATLALTDALSEIGRVGPKAR
jgi:hypothetical protein